jgi:hypothetical protein
VADNGGVQAPTASPVVGGGLLRHLVDEREVRRGFNVDGKTEWVEPIVRAGGGGVLTESCEMAATSGADGGQDAGGGK